MKRLLDRISEGVNDIRYPSPNKIRVLCKVCYSNEYVIYYYKNHSYVITFDRIKPKIKNKNIFGTITLLEEENVITPLYIKINNKKYNFK